MDELPSILLNCQEQCVQSAYMQVQVTATQIQDNLNRIVIHSQNMRAMQRISAEYKDAQKEVADLYNETGHLFLVYKREQQNLFIGDYAALGKICCLCTAVSYLSSEV